MIRALSAAIVMALAPVAAFAADPQPCGMCAEWNRPQEPFSLYGNSYYVGVHGLSAVLITTPSGHVLIDGGLESSTPQVVANIRKMGFRIQDVKYILNSHAHFDHAAALAELQRESGAVVLAGTPALPALTAGVALGDDPQAKDADRYPPVANVRGVTDGEVVRLGELAITAHATPGHTPGGVTWTWQSCEGGKCANIVYADSLSAVASDGYKFTEHAAVLANLERSIAKVEALQCDVLVSAHPEYSDLYGRQAKKRELGSAAMVDTGACRAYAAKARAGLAKRLASERAEK
jgi:metallo-beta-lactamase class B